MRFSFGPTPAEGSPPNQGQPLGNGAGRGSTGVWVPQVPAPGKGCIPRSPGRQRWGKRNPYVGDVNFGVPEAGVENVGQRDRHAQGVCKSKRKHLITGRETRARAAREGGEPQIQMSLREEGTQTPAIPLMAGTYAAARICLSHPVSAETCRGRRCMSVSDEESNSYWDEDSDVRLSNSVLSPQDARSYETQRRGSFLQ